MSRKLNRRAFLGQVSGAVVAMLAAGLVGTPSRLDANAASMNAVGMAPGEGHERCW